MAIEILMPALSPTMEEGTLAKWLVKEGDEVKSGDLLAEIETDKATMEFEAVDEGVIGKILVAEGTEGVKVNAAIAVLLEDGEDASAAVVAAPSTPAAPQAMDVTPIPAATTATPTAPSGTTGGERVFSSPLARRLAKDNGIDISALTGTGPRGRVVKADVMSEKSAPTAQASLTSQPTSMMAAAPADAAKIEAMYADREYDVIELNGMRKIIASRLTEAKQTIPHFYLRRDIMLDDLLAARSMLNKGLEARGVKLSVNDFIIKATALALQTVPAANSVWAGDRTLMLKPSDVAVAVSVEGGLFTPVLKDADTKSLSTLSTEMKDLAARARSKKLQPQEYQGGSFAISNLGMMGIDLTQAWKEPMNGSCLV
ncbi:MAG: dihydrolipoamide acetyltransferase family protein [Planktomarina sp.]